MNFWIVIGWMAMLVGVLCLTGIIARFRFGSRSPGVMGCLSLAVIGFVILAAQEALKPSDAPALLTGLVFMQGAMIALSVFQRVHGRQMAKTVALVDRAPLTVEEIASRVQLRVSTTSDDRSPPQQPEEPPATEDAPIARAVMTPQETGQILARDIAVPALITYRDFQGAPSSRLITIQHVFSQELEPLRYAFAGYIKGWCHKDNAERTFAISRITSIADPKTGEVTSDVADWIFKACGLKVPLGPFRRVLLTPVPPPVLFTWQLGPHDLEKYHLRIDEIETVAGNPVAIAGRGRRLPGGRRRAANGGYRFDITPLPEDLARPISICWPDDAKADPDVVGWIRNLMGHPDAATGA